MPLLRLHNSSYFNLPRHCGRYFAKNLTVPYAAALPLYLFPPSSTAAAPITPCNPAQSPRSLSAMSTSLLVGSTPDSLATELIKRIGSIAQQAVLERGVFNVAVSGGSMPKVRCIAVGGSQGVVRTTAVVGQQPANTQRTTHPLGARSNADLLDDRRTANAERRVYGIPSVRSSAIRHFRCLCPPQNGGNRR